MRQWIFGFGDRTQDPRCEKADLGAILKKLAWRPVALEVRRESVAGEGGALGEEEAVEGFGMVMACRFRAIRRWLEGRGAGGGTSTRRGAAATAPKVRGQTSEEGPPRGARRGFRARRAYLRGSSRRRDGLRRRRRDDRPPCAGDRRPCPMTAGRSARRPGPAADARAGGKARPGGALADRSGPIRAIPPMRRE